MDLKKLRGLAEAIRAQTVWEASPGIVVKLMDCSDGILALLDAAKNYGLDADHARNERDAMQAENETLRAVLRDIMTEELIPDGYPLLMARARSALDGGGV